MNEMDMVDTESRGEISALLEELLLELHTPKRLVVRRGPRQILVAVDEIDWIEAEGNYARLHVGDSSYLIRETLTNLESRLRRTAFVRIQRSTLVNLDRVVEIRRGDVLLQGGKELRLTRGYRANLEKALEGN